MVGTRDQLRTPEGRKLISAQPTPELPALIANLLLAKAAKMQPGKDFTNEKDFTAKAQALVELGAALIPGNGRKALACEMRQRAKTPVAPARIRTPLQRGRSEARPSASNHNGGSRNRASPGDDDPDLDSESDGSSRRGRQQHALVVVA